MATKRMSLETRRPASPAAVFPPRRDYASLSLRDLLDARDAYHVYLSSLDNVVATAIGRYLIHDEDWYASHPPGSLRPESNRKPTSARTLANSVLRPWSWPSVLVFVKAWKQPKELGTSAVPPCLYMPDGRVAPVCVVEAAPDEALPPQPPIPFPTTPLLGGGYTCLREHQGIESFGTFACLVRKGGTYYALTNRHVAGGDGEAVRAYVRGRFEQVGTTSGFAVDRLAMPSVFASWPYEKSLLTMDAGLVRVEDVNDWTSQSFGIGEIGEVFEATEYSLTLDLIGTPVRAFSARAGVSEGEIRALFFRFESSGGFDHVTDVLIGPRREAVKTKDAPRPFTEPGDSGSLWFYDPLSDPRNKNVDHALHTPPPPPIELGKRAARLRPVAMQWGGQRTVLPNGAKASYALGTFLSSICTALDVEIDRSWSLGHEEYWGKIGHFTIGFKACDQLSGKIGKLMKANQKRVGLDDQALSNTFTVDRKKFVPLADVPDYVWIGTRPTNEPVQHFADIDIRDIHGGPSLLDRCHADPSQIAASVWKAYFDGFASEALGPEEGVLPFRVWQIYDAMVRFATKKDVIHFVAAAGVMAHYVGDASQPLHCSFMHHGVPPMKKFQGRDYPFPRSSPEFETFKKTKSADIHGIYEEQMLEVDPAAALALVDHEIASTPAPSLPGQATGHDAAVQVLRLMHDAQARLSPLDIIQADDPSKTAKQRAAALWNNMTIRNATAKSLADSIVTLAALWSAAWSAGKGSTIAASKLVAFSEDRLVKIYRKENGFLTSTSLKTMASSGKFEP